MTTRENDAEGRFLGIPYDWRRPRWAKVKARLYDPNGPLFPPKVWGWGWTINFAHPAAKWLLGGLLIFAVLSVLFLG